MAMGTRGADALAILRRLWDMREPCGQGVTV